MSAYFTEMITDEVNQFGSKTALKSLNKIKPVKREGKVQLFLILFKRKQVLTRKLLLYQITRDAWIPKLVWHGYRSVLS